MEGMDFVKQDEWAQSRLAAIVESSHDAIISKTLSGIITTWNAAAERLFGYSAAEIIGSPMTRIFPPERYAEEAEILARLARGEMVDHFETVRLTKDGRRLDVSVTVSPIKDSAGRIIGASKILRDITERKAREQERDKLIADLQQALTEIRTLHGLLPICAWCKKVRDDQGYWEDVATFFAKKEGLELTHSICPACAAKM